MRDLILVCFICEGRRKKRKKEKKKSCSLLAVAAAKERKKREEKERKAVAVAVGSVVDVSVACIAWPRGITGRVQCAVVPPPS